MDAINFEQGSIFDLFGGAPAPAVTEVKAEKKDKKAAAKKSSSSKAGGTKGRKFDGPVTVFGTGWKYVFGEAGKTYTPDEVLKGTYDAGYRGIICASRATRWKKDAEVNNVLFLEDISATATKEDTAAPEVEVILGQKAAQLSAENFEGKDAEEITLGDVRDKWVELNPEFKGCELKFMAGPNIAVPVFSDKVKLSDEKDETVKIWSDEGVREYPTAEAVGLYEDYGMYKSEAGVYFAQPKVGDIAKSENLFISTSTFGVEEKKAEAVKERYALPAKIWLEQYGQSIDVTPEMFGGKDKVVQGDIINFLKPNYKAFQSKSRKFDIFYDEEQKLISVYMVSGKKGAAAAVVPFPGKAVDTAIGSFFTLTTRQGIAVWFQRGLRLMPHQILSAIIAYFRVDTRNEAMVQVYYSPERDEFYLKKPYQVVSKVSVDYRMEHTSDILVLTAHSHNTMPAIFSSIDDEDECYTGLFMVVGRLNRPVPEVSLRAGVEGDFGYLSLSDIFDMERSLS